MSLSITFQCILYTNHLPFRLFQVKPAQSWAENTMPSIDILHLCRYHYNFPVALSWDFVGLVEAAPELAAVCCADIDFKKKHLNVHEVSPEFSRNQSPEETSYHPKKLHCKSFMATPPAPRSSRPSATSKARRLRRYSPLYPGPCYLWSRRPGGRPPGMLF